MSGYKAAVVCADLDTQQTIVDFINMFGYELTIKTQYGYDCALDVLHNSPDLVLCDCFNFDYDAISLYENLKELGVADKLVFAVVSSVTDSSFINQVLKAGVDLYCLLPTDFDALDLRIKQLIANKNSQKSVDVEYTSKEFKLRTHIKSLAVELGLSHSISGSEYIVEGVYFCIDNGSKKLTMTKDIYPYIADVFNTSALAVERAIRSAVDKSWLQANIDLINEMFGYSVDADKGRPTNKDYIWAFVDKVKTDLKIK